MSGQVNGVEYGYAPKYRSVGNAPGWRMTQMDKKEIRRWRVDQAIDSGHTKVEIATEIGTTHQNFHAILRHGKRSKFFHQIDAWLDEHSIPRFPEDEETDEYHAIDPVGTIAQVTGGLSDIAGNRNYPDETRMLALEVLSIVTKEILPVVRERHADYDNNGTKTASEDSS